MAKNDDPPAQGLLSKVTQFMRSPTRDWAQINPTESEPENSYSKETLKAMIERKRQNDFVRKREFDQLRKIRRRDIPVKAEQPGGLSFFQTSLPSNLDERAQTLKKIDEIEAQMSRQWWKGKQSAQVSGDRPAGFAASRPAQQDTDFAPTEASIPYVGADLVTDFSMTLNEPGRNTEATGRVAANSPSPGVGADEKTSLPVHADLVNDAVLQAAAIRFANGDAPGAEDALQSAILNAAGQPTAAWMMALLDLYRATGQREKFEQLSLDFAGRFSQPPWVWVDLSRRQGSSAHWSSPEQLTLACVEALQGLTVGPKETLHLNWRRLRTFHDDACEPLGRLIHSWCKLPIRLYFSGHEKLDRALKVITPTTRPEVSVANWQLRMDTLQLMGLQDEFELVALEYALTYGLATPSWQSVLSVCELDAPRRRDLTLARTMSADTSQGFELAGEVLGEAAQAITHLKKIATSGEPMDIDCSHLTRLDFSAAGGLLSWLSERSAQSARIRFINVNRLLVTFLNVIGIAEFATVVPRAD